MAWNMGTPSRASAASRSVEPRGRPGRDPMSVPTAADRSSSLLLSVQRRAGNAAVGHLLAGDARDPSLHGHVAVVQRGKGKAAKKAVGWIVKVGQRKLVKVQAVYSEKELAKLLAKGYNVLVSRGSGAAKRVGKKVWGKEMIHHNGHIVRATGKLGRPHFQPARRLIGRSGERGWHVFYGVAPVLFFADDAEAMAVYEDKYPGRTFAKYLTVTEYVGEDSWLRHLDWINPGELLAIGGDIGRDYDRERTKKLKALVFNRQTPNGAKQTYELSPEGKLVRVIVVSAAGKKVELSADQYFEMLGTALAKQPEAPGKNGTAHPNFDSEFDAEYRIYNSKRGWSVDRKTASYYMPKSETARLKKVGGFFVSFRPDIGYLYVIVHPKHRQTLREPGFQVPESGIPGYLAAPDKAAHLDRLFAAARKIAVVEALFDR